MKYVDLKGFGGAEQLMHTQGPKPDYTEDDVLIEVCAAGVNRPDLIQRQGLYPPPKSASPILGLEVAGVIRAVGDGVQGWQVGDRVCALTNGGGYAEFCAVPAGQCLPIPQGLTMIEAASLPETVFTVWFNLFHQGCLKKGQSLLVHGGSSGIGTMAIQMARAFGVTVYTTVGSVEKARACEALGVARAIQYKTEDFVEVIKGETRGVDMILDMVGGDYINRNIKCLAPKGRLINIAYLTGSQAEVNFMAVMMKQLTLTGSTLRQQSAALKAQLGTEIREKVWPLLEKGRIRSVMDQIYPLAEVQKAHERMESNEHIGKIMLLVSNKRDEIV